MRLIEQYLPPVIEDGIRTAKAIGYGTGAGATVTQASSITTGVSIDALAGKITTVATTLEAQAAFEFVVTNPKVEATDVVLVSSTYAGAGSCMVSVSQVTDGSFSIVVQNATTATTALNAAVGINFAVIKSVVA